MQLFIHLPISNSLQLLTVPYDATVPEMKQAIKAQLGIGLGWRGLQMTCNGSILEMNLRESNVC